MDSFGTVSLSEEQPFGKVSLNEPNQVAAVPPEIAQPRAEKAHFGLGDQSPGFDTLLNGIANGQEPQLRRDIAKQYDAYLRLEKMKTISDMAHQQGAEANMGHVQALLDWNPTTHPDMVFERPYAQSFINQAVHTDLAMAGAAQEHDPVATARVMEKTEDIVTNQETFKKIEADAEEYYNKQIPRLRRMDNALTVVPLFSAAQLRNVVIDTPSLLPGNNLDEQITYLWGLPPEQAASTFKAVVQKLQAVNPLNALVFSQAVNGYSEQQRIDMNLMAGLDATIVGGPILKLARLMKGAVVGNSSKVTDVGKTLEAVGDIPKAADVKAVEQTKARLQPEVMPVVNRGFDPLGQKLDLTSTLPSWANPNTLMTPGNLGSLSRQRAAQIADVLVADNKAIENTTSKVLRVSRTTDADLQVGLARTKERLEEQYPHLQDAVLDQRNISPFEHLRAEDTRTNVDYVLMNVGKEGKTTSLANDLGFPLGPPNTPTKQQPFLDSRGSGGYFHGAPSPVTLNEGHYGSSTSYYGTQGLYTTDALDVAQGYANKRGATKPTIYEARVDPKGLKIHDMEAPISGDLEQHLNAVSKEKGQHADIVSDALSAKPKNLREFFDEVREIGAGERIPANDIQEGIFHPIMDFLESKGFHGMSHIGGLKTKTPEHKVTIFFSPEKNVKLMREMSAGELAGLRIKAPEFLKAKEADFGEVIVGKEGSTLFKSATQADQYAQDLYGLHYKEYRTMQGPGNSWYISIIKPVDETDPALRALSLETRNKNSESWANYMAGYYKTPASQVSQFIRDNRLIATTASTEMHKLAKNLAEPIKGSYLGTPGLSKYSFQRLNDTLEYYRDYVDYSKPQARGMYPTSLFQLEKDWKKVTGKLPTAREQEAFWSVVKINDLDWTLRNYNTHRDLARQGVEHIAIPHPTEEKTYTNPFMGKVLRPEDMRRFWDNPEDAVISIYRNKEYEHTTKHSNRMAADDELKEWINKPNTKVVQIANPDDRPLKGILDRNPHFVISEDVQRSELPIKLVDYNGGGHVIYPGKWYVKQPVVEQGLLGKHYHYGDQTIFNFNSSAQAKLYGGRMDEFRLMLKAGKTDVELDTFIQKNLPKDLEFWKNKFLGKDAILSLDHPIMITERNNTTFATNPDLKRIYKERLGEDVISYPESSYNLMAGVDKTFMMERDGPLMSIAQTGLNPWSPVYTLFPAKTLKPLQAMDQGIQSAIRGLYMNDVKTATVEQFIKQYKTLIDMPIEKIERNPYFAFYHGKPKKEDSSNPEVAQALASMENTRRNLKNFLRTSTDLQGQLDVAEEKLMQSFYNKTGSDRTINWYADKDLYMIKHPVDFLSKAVSSMKFGFFNVLQSVVQSMGAIHAISFHPIHGYSGATGAMLSYWGAIAEGTLTADVSKGVMKMLDMSATKYGGWKKGWFPESQEALNSTGFFNIGREVSVRDSIMDQSLFSTKAGNLLDKSYMPFNFGERNARLVSWHMAFHEWKTNNPTRELDSRSIGEILNRANQYNGDMIRESNSAMQQGTIGSIPTKFQSFRMRIAEQYMGDRWTKQEKATSLAFNSMVYGVPTAVGAAIGVENFYEDLRKAAIERGFTLNNKYIQWMHEGILDQIVEAATGTSYSIAKRLGPGPDTSLKDMFDPEKFLQTAVGPMGSALESIAKAVYPLYAGVYTAIRGGQEQYSITNDEILDVIKELSVVNNAHNAYMALNYQRYVSRNKQVVVDPKVSSTGLPPMSGTDAAMMLLLGVTRKDISDVRLGQDVYKHQQDAESTLGKRATEEMRKMYMALGEENFTLADKYLVNAKIMLTILGDASEAKQLQVQKQALSEAGTTVADRVNQLLYDPARMPPSRIPERMKKHFNIDVRQGSPF